MCEMCVTTAITLTWLFHSVLCLRKRAAARVRSPRSSRFVKYSSCPRVGRYSCCAWTEVPVVVIVMCLVFKVLIVLALS